MTTILDWDYALFNFFNHACANGFLDAIVPHWREMEFWFPFYAMLILFLLMNFPWKKALILIAFLFATVGVTDFTGSQIIKDTVERPRPCHEGTVVDARTFALVGCGSGYSFVSNHAANHMAIAVFLVVTIGFISRYFNYFILFWAITIGLGQIYVGVHYPSDVLAGFILGALIGYLLGSLFNRFFTLNKEAT